jgi:hypothetical protein
MIIKDLDHTKNITAKQAITRHGKMIKRLRIKRIVEWTLWEIKWQNHLKEWEKDLKRFAELAKKNAWKWK